MLPNHATGIEPITSWSPVRCASVSNNSFWLSIALDEVSFQHTLNNNESEYFYWWYSHQLYIHSPGPTITNCHSKQRVVWWKCRKSCSSDPNYIWFYAPIPVPPWTRQIKCSNESNDIYQDYTKIAPINKANKMQQCIEWQLSRLHQNCHLIKCCHWYANISINLNQTAGVY